MIQQAHQEQAQTTSAMYAASLTLGRIFVTILRLPFVVLRKIGSNVLYGFSVFAGEAEQYGLPRN